MGLRTAARQRRGFTLLELMAVVMIILIMIGALGLTLARSQPAVRVKKDASQAVAFLRNMWDRTKAVGAPLVLNPDYEKGALSYTDPRTGREDKAKFSRGVKLLAIKINDRVFSQTSMVPVEDETYQYGDIDDTLYISEGRGLTTISIVFGIPREEETVHITAATLNLITGKGLIEPLSQEDLGDILAAADADAAAQMEPVE